MYGETLVVRLGRLATMYAPQEDSVTVRDRIVMEILLKSLPREAARYVREKEPSTACQAADQASRFTSRGGIEELKYSTLREGRDRDTYKALTLTFVLTAEVLIGQQVTRLV